MRDLRDRSWRQQKEAQDRLRVFLSSHGYQVLETPVLEPTELFLRKSGGELAARMYTFTDPGGNQVSLRPEYTASVLRHYLEETSKALPARVQYAGPVFRYQGDDSSLRQFTQVGAELIGAASPRADAEILSLSHMALSRLGLAGHRLDLSDQGVMYGLLESLELSERAIAFTLSSVSDLKGGLEGVVRVRERAMQLGLMSSGPGEAKLGTVLGNMGDAEVRELMYGLLQWRDVGSLGQREPSEVVERLVRRLRSADDPARLQQGLELAAKLANVRGEPAACLDEAGRLIRSAGLDPSGLDRLKEVIEVLDGEDLDAGSVLLDLGLARGLAYYSGIVFEIRHPALEDSLGGGGRYDGLARALGGASNVPALGFAFTLEHLLEGLQQADGMLGEYETGPRRALMMGANGMAYQKALRLARELRGEGTTVEMEVCGMGLEECLAYARDNGIDDVIEVHGDGGSMTHSTRGEGDPRVRPQRSPRKGYDTVA